MQLTRLQIPGDGNQKLGHQGLVQQLLAVAWGRLGVPQSLQQPDNPDLPVWAEHIAVFLRRQTETTAQVCLRRRGLVPLIGLSGGNLRPVNGAPGHQNHISRLQGIALALNGIGGAPGKQYQDFVKAVVMPIHRSHDGVLQMK